MGIDNLKKFAVIGAGGMGSGIADLLSRMGGYEVVMCDTPEDLVQRGLDTHSKN